VVVNDGSSDDTLQRLLELQSSIGAAAGVDLRATRQEAALTAGCGMPRRLRHHLDPTAGPPN